MSQMPPTEQLELQTVEASEAERRTAPRLSCPVGVLVKVQDKWLSCVTRDVGPGGMRVIPTHRLPSGEMVDVELVRSGQKGRARVRSRDDHDALILENPTDMFLDALESAARKRRLS